MIIFEIFLELTRALHKYEVDYIIIGGIAINLHGFARNTEDIDIFIKPENENIEKFNKALYEVFQDKEISQITTSELKKYSVIRYGTEFDFYIDIITSIGEKFKFDDLKYQKKIIDNVPVKVADLKTLYKLKEKTFREIDQLDLKYLKEQLKDDLDAD